MALLPRYVGVAMDLAGCPNRCRHCYLGHGPNRRLPAEILREVAAAFWSWRRSGAAEPWFHQVDVASWYREPDFSDDYRDLFDLERELSRREPRRYEPLSVWRLARDESYALWAREHGPRACQITFFGMERLTDEFSGRQGAFADAIRATERLLEVGIIPQWQVILTKPGLGDLPDLVRLADEMGLSRRVASLGAEFRMFCHPPSPDGAAIDLENVRIEQFGIASIPVDLLEATREHFGGTIDWRPESALIEEVLAGRAIPTYVPEATWFFVNADLDVFSSYGDLTPAWCLGNFRRDGLAAILATFEDNRVPAMRVAFHTADIELAGRFGRRESGYLYSASDLKARWVRLASSRP